MLLHLTLVCQMPVIEHKIDRHGGRSWKPQHSLPCDKPHGDDSKLLYKCFLMCNLC